MKYLSILLNDILWQVWQFLAIYDGLWQSMAIRDYEIPMHEITLKYLRNINEIHFCIYEMQSCNLWSAIFESHSESRLNIAKFYIPTIKMMKLLTYLKVRILRGRGHKIL